MDFHFCSMKIFLAHGEENCLLLTLVSSADLMNNVAVEINIESLTSRVPQS